MMKPQNKFHSERSEKCFLNFNNFYGFFASLGMTLLKRMKQLKRMTLLKRMTQLSNCFNDFIGKILRLASITLFFFFLFLDTNNKILCFEKDKLPQTNFRILDSLSREISDNVCDFFLNKGIKKVCLSLENHPGAWLLEQKILSSGNAKGISFYDYDSTNVNNVNSIKLVILDMAISYSINQKNKDSIIRTAIVKIGGHFSQGGVILSIPEYSVNYTDELALDDIDLIKSPEYSFANPIVPKTESSFFYEIAEPVIVITSAIITVILLFSVRSR